MEGEICVEIASPSCSCQNGRPVTGDDCPDEGGAICADCYPGYKKNLVTNSCEPKVCQCANGQPVTGGNCLNESIQNCAVCDSGFHQKLNQIADFISVQCVRDVECGEFEHPEIDTNRDIICVRNKCFCLNGKASVDCPSHLAMSCEACNRDFELNSDQVCEPTAVGGPLCTCENGIGANKAQGCPENGVEMCVACYSPGYKVDANFECVEKRCLCKNGIGVQDGSCMDEGVNRCRQCYVGYHRQNDECVENLNCADNQHLDILVGTQRKEDSLICSDNVCVCPNGRAAVETCTRHMDLQCLECDEGFMFDGELCVKNVSDPVNWEDLLEDMCLAPGQKLENGVCVDKVCQCNNGVAISNGACFDESVTKCDSCAPGYHLKIGEHGSINCVERLKCGQFEHPAVDEAGDIYCERNVCLCRHGQAAVDCDSHLAMQCKSCDTGYKLKNSSVCVNKSAAGNNDESEDEDEDVIQAPVIEPVQCAANEFKNQAGNCIVPDPAAIIAPKTKALSQLATTLTLEGQKYCLGVLDIQNPSYSPIGLVTCDSNNAFRSIRYSTKGKSSNIVYLRENWMSERQCLSFKTLKSGSNLASVKMVKCSQAEKVKAVKNGGPNLVFASGSGYKFRYLIEYQRVEN